MSSAPTGWSQALERDVRANPCYRLLARDSLPVGYRHSLEDAGVDLSAVFGLLVDTRDSGLASKVVDAAGAELFTDLQTPGRLPLHAAGRLAELVLDGVLEVDSEEGFVTGPLAYEAVIGHGNAETPLDRLTRLSYAALDYADRLCLTDVGRTTGRLYFYNRVPQSPGWQRAYPGPSAVLDLLMSPALAHEWVGGASGDAGEIDWLMWTRRDLPRRRPVELPYKLYVSPAVEALPDVLPMLVDALTGAGARRFKVGPDASGLLRPDKIVVYMADAPELERIARALEVALDGVSPHGVPFTAELAGDGLLSWGGDPTADDAPVGGGLESWRVSVSRRLAEYLTAAQTAPLRRIRPADFALARLAIDGVDVHSFAPAGLEPPRRRQPLAAGRR